MNTIEVLGICAFNLISLIVGVKIGQLASRGRDITLNPVKAIKNEIRDNKETKEEILRKKKINTMLSNIDKFNGSGLGQEPIPKD